MTSKIGGLVDTFASPPSTRPHQPRLLLKCGGKSKSHGGQENTFFFFLFFFFTSFGASTSCVGTFCFYSFQGKKRHKKSTRKLWKPSQLQYSTVLALSGQVSLSLLALESQQMCFESQGIAFVSLRPFFYCGGAWGGVESCKTVITSFASLSLFSNLCSGVHSYSSTVGVAWSHLQPPKQACMPRFAVQLLACTLIHCTVRYCGNVSWFAPLDSMYAAPRRAYLF